MASAPSTSAPASYVPPSTEAASIFETPNSFIEQALTTTVVSTWIVMLLLFVLVALAYSSLKHSGKLSGVFLDIIGRLDTYTSELFEGKEKSRPFFFFLAAIFLFIIFGNIVGLMFDWIALALAGNHALAETAHHYLRPIHSDLNTTIGMALITILIAQVVAIRQRGFFAHFGHYLFNWTGSSIIEKPINVFVGWLHFIGEFIRIGSLSMRLFLNIFVGAILLGVMAYIGSIIPGAGVYIGGLLVLPMWFFELLVAGLQAFIFLTLASVYLREATTPLHHGEEHH